MGGIISKTHTTMEKEYLLINCDGKPVQFVSDGSYVVYGDKEEPSEDRQDDDLGISAIIYTKKENGNFTAAITYPDNEDKVFGKFTYNPKSETDFYRKLERFFSKHSFG